MTSAREPGDLPLLSPACLTIDCAAEARRIESFVRDAVATRLRKRGVVVGVSGGIDSSVTAALCVRALGCDRVLALFTPEQDSAAETLSLSRLMAESLGVESVYEDLTPLLLAAGAYRRRDEAIRAVIPEYGSTWKAKLVSPSALDAADYRVFSIVARAEDGTEVRRRLTPQSYLTIVAATSCKQRLRKMLEYFHADSRNYAVAGTPNRLEHDQGFFVKQGDGTADLKPIAHLYKSQVYQLAEFLGVPAEIRSRQPTTDTYSLPQGQDEFFFSLPYAAMDLCLYAKNHGYSAAAAATALGLLPAQAEAVYRDIDRKRQTTQPLHMPALLVEAVREVAVSERC